MVASGEGLRWEPSAGTPAGSWQPECFGPEGGSGECMGPPPQPRTGHRSCKEQLGPFAEASAELASGG